MPDVAITIIGGGAVGLAIAAELSNRYSPLLLLERNNQFGMETSSRNSEVIHAGMYYPTNSLKACLCVKGNALLYELCEKHGIPYRRLGKIITAAAPEEMEEIEKLFDRGTANGVPMQRLTADEVHALEPRITTVGGLLSPTTGIISAHGLMDYYARTARAHGAILQARSAVVAIERVSGGYRLTVDERNERTSITSERVINAAGLESDTIAGMAGIETEKAGYRLHWCKGSYFSVPGSYRGSVSRLVYPVPTHHTLGVHVVLDLVGRMRFGPDLEFLRERVADYTVDPARRDAFAESVRKILPFVHNEDLVPDMAGIRPKLQSPNETFRDFVIRDEADRGLPGFIDLVGIDSPGLTSSAAIAKKVGKIAGQ